MADVLGTLHVVATPIGNLGDLTPRAAEVLRSVRALAAEDTRRSARLFAHLGVPPPPMISLPAFDERGRLEAVLERLRAGEDVALVTDAGTPAISDPGAALVAAAWEIGARVVPVPGPSASLAAISASGFPADRFYFAGFLPRKGGGRAEAVGAIARAGVTAVLHEAGNRTVDTLRDLAAALGDRPALLARELTKLHEELLRGPLTQLAAALEARDEVKGEVTLVIGPPAPGEASGAEPEAAAEPLDDELRRRLQAGEAPSALARDVAKARGMKRSDVYDAIQRIRGG